MQRRLCLLTSCCGVPVSNPFWELGITSLYLYHQGKNALGSTFSNKRNLASSHLPQPILIPAPALDHYCVHPHLPTPTCPPALSVPKTAGTCDPSEVWASSCPSSGLGVAQALTAGGTRGDIENALRPGLHLWRLGFTWF